MGLFDIFKKAISQTNQNTRPAFQEILIPERSEPQPPFIPTSKEQIVATGYEAYYRNGFLYNVNPRNKRVSLDEDRQTAYVYIISNIGAFGENIYKIGMTRRLDPQERIDELSDASVPFNFDIHAMIFSDNAPALETALHRAFENKKLNMVNQRREFFNVTLDEIKEVVMKNFDKSVEFIEIPEAEQYRTSLKMKENK